MTGAELVDILDSMNPITQFEEGLALIWKTDICGDELRKHINYWKFYKAYVQEELPYTPLPEELFEI